MNSDERILELPQPIIDRLREVIGRVRRHQWIKGGLLTVAAAVGAVVGVMGLDAAFALEALPLRLTLSLSGLGVVGWAAWTQWVRPLRRKISLTAVARWVEGRHPELQERISTAVELVGGGAGREGQESRELLRAVVEDAVADVGRMNPAEELGAQRSRPAKWLAGSAVAFLVGLAALWPNQVPRLLARALAPLSDVGNAWADRLRVLTPSQVVAWGDPLSIEVALRGRRERVELRFTGPDGSELVETLAPDGAVPVLVGEQGYALRLPKVEHGFSARVVAGKAVSATFRIEAIARPEAGPLTITYDYPDYTGLPDAVKPGASGEIAALEGTRVSVAADLVGAVSRARVTIGGEEWAGVELSGEAAAPRVRWSAVMAPQMDAAWSLQLEEGHGLASRPVGGRMRATADLPPSIVLENPVEDRLELRPVERLALTYFVAEDWGLSAVQLRIRPQEGAEYFLPAGELPEAVPDRAGEYRGRAELDLSKLVVPEGQEIRVSVMAADRLPTERQGPQRAYSREIVIRLNRWTRPQVEQKFAAQHQEVRQKMEEVKQALQSARGLLADKPERLKTEEKLSAETLKDLEAGAQQMKEARGMMEKLQERIKETAYARQKGGLQEIAQDMVRPAEAAAKDVPLSDQKAARAALAQTARNLLDDAIKKMEQEQQQMDQAREAVQKVAQLSDIAEQQQRLAAEAAAAERPAAAASPDKLTEAGAAASPAAPTPAAAGAPAEEAQQKWLEDQRAVAARARQLAEEVKQSNPQAAQDQFRQAAAQAVLLAAEAEALGQKQSGLAAALASASPPEARLQGAAAQVDLARQVAALQEKATGFQQGSARQIDQSLATQEAAYAAQANLQEGAGLARRAGEELAAAAAPAADATPAVEPASTPAAATPTPTPTPAAGQQAAQDSARTLAAAAASLKALGVEFQGLAGQVAEHGKSLGEGAEQAGEAVAAAEQGAGQGMQQGAAAAQQAAEQLALAANTALQAMSIPASAKSSQASPPSAGPGQAKDGPPSPSGDPGQEGKDGLQGDAASGELPAELAKLGLTPDDWMKLRSALQGVEGARDEAIPAEYRDLVKAYFGALSKGGKIK